MRYQSYVDQGLVRSFPDSCTCMWLYFFLNWSFPSIKSRHSYIHIWLLILFSPSKMKFQLSLYSHTHILWRRYSPRQSKSRILMIEHMKNVLHCAIFFFLQKTSSFELFEVRVGFTNFILCSFSKQPIFLPPWHMF